jgi:outer membrane lipoprotein-sorting protein
VKYKSAYKFIFVLLLLLPASCISIARKRVLPDDQRLLPAKTETRAELSKYLLERSKEVQTLQGTIALDVTGGGAKSGVLTEYHQTKGYVLVERPGHIRLKVEAPIVLSTVLDMASDGRQVRVSIPVKNKFLIFDVNAPPRSQNPVENLRPQHLLDGLFVDIQPYLNDPKIKSLFEETIQGRHSYYVFSFINISGDEGQLLEKLWIDRTEMNVARKQVFGKDGRIETDVEYSKYASVGEKLFPQLVVIQRPIEDYTLRIAFQQTALNEKLADNAFTLEQPEGSDLVQLAQ